MDLPFQIDLHGKVAVVTGGGGVLCGPMARALAAAGARVALCGRRADPLEAVAAAIRTAGGEALALAGCDVLDVASLRDANLKIERAFGSVDILINGAGGNHPGGTTAKSYLEAGDLARAGATLKTFYELDPEGVQYVFNLNLMGTLLPTQIFTRSMAERRAGTVINISSMSAFRPLTKIPAYSGAKAAVNSFTQWLAVHMSQAGIRVNAIAPGFFVTEQNRAMLKHPDGGLTERGEKIIGHTPMGRFGEPGDLIGTLLWLVSDRGAGFVTGVVVPVDGGFSAYSGV